MAKSNHSTAVPTAAPRTALRTAAGSALPSRASSASELIRMALVLGVKVGVRSIGDEHVAGRAEDCQRRAGLECDGLRCHPACPEDWHLARREPHGFAEVRGAKGGDRERRQVSDV